MSAEDHHKGQGGRDWREIMALDTFISLFVERVKEKERERVATAFSSSCVATLVLHLEKKKTAGKD